MIPSPEPELSEYIKTNNVKFKWNERSVFFNALSLLQPSLFVSFPFLGFTDLVLQETGVLGSILLRFNRLNYGDSAARFLAGLYSHTERR